MSQFPNGRPLYTRHRPSSHIGRQVDLGWPLAMKRMRATSISPNQWKGDLLPRPLLKQQPTLLVEQKNGKSPVQLQRSLGGAGGEGAAMGRCFRGAPQDVVVLVDQEAVVRLHQVQLRLVPIPILAHGGRPAKGGNIAARPRKGRPQESPSTEAAAVQERKACEPCRSDNDRCPQRDAPGSAVGGLGKPGARSDGRSGRQEHQRSDLLNSSGRPARVRHWPPHGSQPHVPKAATAATMTKQRGQMFMGR
mmetsp:Transcript_171082/g.548255  ORF Transcript_171082/g.548255 Transcript_171082/m.548255 type:complete len:249 (-) Transcript_171082:151-897(-)